MLTEMNSPQHNTGLQNLVQPPKPVQMQPCLKELLSHQPTEKIFRVKWRCAGKSREHVVTSSQVAVFTTIQTATQAAIQAKLLWQMKAFQSRQFCSTCKVPPDFANHQLRRLYPFAKNGQCDFSRRIFPEHRHQTHYRPPKSSALTKP